MLPAESRLRRGAEITAVVRGGRRAANPGTALVVVHLLTDPDRGTLVPRAGLVVSRAVGPAVTRNVVRRRLRHLLRERLAATPWTGDLVVRALPAAAGVGYAELAAALDEALARAIRPRRAVEVSR